MKTRLYKKPPLKAKRRLSGVELVVGFRERARARELSLQKKETAAVVKAAKVRWLKQGSKAHAVRGEEQATVCKLVLKEFSEAQSTDKCCLRCLKAIEHGNPTHG